MFVIQIQVVFFNQFSLPPHLQSISVYGTCFPGFSSRHHSQQQPTKFFKGVGNKLISYNTIIQKIIIRTLPTEKTTKKNLNEIITSYQLALQFSNKSLSKPKS